MIKATHIQVSNIGVICLGATKIVCLACLCSGSRLSDNFLLITFSFLFCFLFFGFLLFTIIFWASVWDFSWQNGGGEKSEDRTCRLLKLPKLGQLNKGDMFLWRSFSWHLLVNASFIFHFHFHFRLFLFHLYFSPLLARSSNLLRLRGKRGKRRWKGEGKQGDFSLPLTQSLRLNNDNSALSLRLLDSIQFNSIIFTSVQLVKFNEHHVTSSEFLSRECSWRIRDWQSGIVLNCWW